MPRKIKIFGYGSLINKDSLLKTIPEFSNFFPAKVEGFVRVFNICDKKFVANPKFPKCVLNVEKSEGNFCINGVCFEVDSSYFDRLVEREEGYELVKVEVKDYENDKNIYSAFMFRVLHYEPFDFQFGNEDQVEYLNMCFRGCREISDEFLIDFKKTTFIGKKTLDELDM